MPLVDEPIRAFGQVFPPRSTAVPARLVAKMNQKRHRKSGTNSGTFAVQPKVFTSKSLSDLLFA
jgi:hypothetical protein